MGSNRGVQGTHLLKCWLILTFCRRPLPTSENPKHLCPIMFRVVVFSALETSDAIYLFLLVVIGDCHG
jgi:hypothetical protein